MSDRPLAGLLRSPRFWLVSAGASLATVVILGIPSGIIPNPLFIRMVPTRVSDVVIWLMSAPLVGLTIGTFVTRSHAPNHGRDGELRVGAGSIAVYFAIACPVCNKIVLLALGISGALNVFAPIQPLLGAVSLLFLAATLGYRLRQIRRGCTRCAAAVRVGPG
jgi:hypothetical protein